LSYCIVLDTTKEKEKERGTTSGKSKKEKKRKCPPTKATSLAPIHGALT
jgi:hypothetical protein